MEGREGRRGKGKKASKEKKVGEGRIGEFVCLLIVGVSSYFKHWRAGFELATSDTEELSSYALTNAVVHLFLIIRS